MRSASLLILLEGWELNVGLDRRRPKSLASAESLAFKVCVEEAHLEFFRMAEVTASISEYKTCFFEIGPAAVACPVAEAMMDLRRIRGHEIYISALSKRRPERHPFDWSSIP